ncbi:MAG: cyanophycin synthetase [bacterium]|nr:cyanophycin synthetase [bacterium]
MGKKIPYLTKLVTKLAPKFGARVVVEPEWHYAAQIIYPNGVVRSLKFYSLDLNNVASSDIAKDKDFAKFFLKKNNFPVAKGITIFDQSWATVIGSDRTIKSIKKYASKLGYPLIVKPNSKSQGADVFLVHNEIELKKSLYTIFKGDKVAIIEEYMPGADYRIVVLDGEVISAYERIALSVIGDGKKSIKQLLIDKQKHFDSSERDTKINPKDTRIKAKLKTLGYTQRSILKKDEKIFLLDNANLSTGGDSVDVTDTIHNDYKKIAIDITAKMGLRICGVDIMVRKGDITKSLKNSKYFVLEINAAPGLDHYVTTGKKQKVIVEAMYLKILKALGKKDQVE